MRVRTAALVALFSWLTIAACSSWAQPPFFGSTRVLNLIAHQDDDLLMMSPDLLSNIRAGRAVQTVVFTDGDAGLCQSYVEERAQGQKLAYEVMANASYNGAWIQSTPTIIAGHRVLMERMPGAGRDISILYVGMSNNGNRDLERIWNDYGSTLRINAQDTRLAGTSYTRDELIALVRQIIIDFNPTDVNTLDSGKTWPLVGYPIEHSDHVHSALFALAALQRVTPQPVAIQMYRAYNAIAEVENVSEVDAANKRLLYDTYAQHDGYLCRGAFWSICGEILECQDPAHLIYGPFEKRQYPIAVTKNVAPAIRGPGGQCLRSNGMVAGSTLSLGSCATNLEKWSLPADGTLRIGSLCVSSSAGADPTPAATRGALLSLEACNPNVNRQRFLLTGTGHLRGPDATCVSSANPATLELAECGDIDQLGFGINFSKVPFAATNGTDFAGVPTTPQYYKSLTYGDLDGDGDADVCIRRADGVYCSSNNGANMFTGYGRRTAAFRDSDGYNTASTGSTLQLADVDGDGRADLCARKGGFSGDSGVYCARNTGQGAAFEAALKRTNGDDFGDRYGYAASPAYYGSIRFADVNGDAKVDVCGRNADGIECATNNAAGTFVAASQRENVEFSDWLGWRLSSFGTTMQYADVDGDGRNDVCGRGAQGMLCMLGTGSTAENAGFERPHTWSDTGDFSDAEGWGAGVEYYGSIRLGDINGDGRADVCGRNASGVWCGLSTGQAFAPARLVVPADPFTDAYYGNAQNGASLALLRLDADTHYDVCLRGSLAPAAGTGLRCTIAP